MTSLWNNFKIAAQLGELEQVPPAPPPKTQMPYSKLLAHGRLKTKQLNCVG